MLFVVNPTDINHQLMDSVGRHDLQTVRKCLEKGANPNFTQDSGNGKELAGVIQPRTPLQLVMFSISDCMLSDRDLEEFAQIASLLIEKGADPRPAMEIAESRYGRYDTTVGESPFMNVWHIIAKAFSANS